LAGASSALDVPLHPDLGLLAQCRRELFLEDDATAIADLQAAINAYLAEHNASPKPFAWTQSADAILAKLDRLPVTSV
jgi:hypothetical protein